MGPVSERLGKTWTSVQNVPASWSLAFVLSVNLALVLWTGAAVLRHFPNSGDEYAYFISAVLFSEGRLSTESPEPRESFNFNHVVNNGKYYGKYPPGWPALLSLGILARAPWIINPILGTLTLFTLYRIGREHFSRETATAALLLTLANPFFILNSASYFSHPSCLLFVTLAVHFGLRAVKNPSSVRDPVLFGAAGAAAFCARPFTALAFLLPVALYFLSSGPRSVPTSPYVRGRALGCGVALAGFSLFLVYNALQTGDPFKQPVSVYDPSEGVGRTPGSQSWAWAVENNGWGRLRDLNEWIPGCLVGCAAYLVQFWRRKAEPAGALLLLCFIGLAGGYFCYLYHPGNQYGPRYLYEASGVLFLVLGSVLSRMKILGLPLLVLVVLTNVALLSAEVADRRDQINGRMQVYDRVREAGLSRAVIFLRTGSGSMEARDLTRNGVHFEQEPILYVRDLGAANAEVLENYPGRQAFVFEEGRLVPWSERR